MIFAKTNIPILEYIDEFLIMDLYKIDQNQMFRTQIFSRKGKMQNNKDIL